MSRINRDDVDKMYDYDLHIPTRTIYMGSVESHIEHGESGVDASMAERIIKALHILDSAAPNGDQPINIIMNNPGGDEYHCLAIYDAIKTCRNHITITVYGMAMSAGGIILQAADKRVMSPNSRFMMHYGSIALNQNATDVYKWIEDYKKIDLFMEELFLEKIKEKNPDFTMKKLRELLRADFIANANDSKNLGLCDEILGEVHE